MYINIILIFFVMAKFLLVFCLILYDFTLIHIHIKLIFLIAYICKLICKVLFLVNIIQRFNFFVSVCNQ